MWMQRDPFVAEAGPLTVGCGAVAVGLCAFPFKGRLRGLADRVEEVGGSIMQRGGGVVNGCGV
jgi:hypothetical protein